PSGVRLRFTRTRRFPYSSLFRSLDLVQAKARGEDVVTPREEEGEGEVVDLMDALRRSVEASRQHKAGNRHQAGALPRSEDEELRSEEHTSELQSRFELVCRLLLE